jgi:UDP-N-acetylglucosamine 2-epimerase (non-hydrolysing)
VRTQPGFDVGDRHPVLHGRQGRRQGRGNVAVHDADVRPVPREERFEPPQDAAVVVTDSGGVQEETTWLGVPCLTVRDATERPVTVKEGTNTLVGRDAGRLHAAIESVLGGGGPPAGGRPDLWDGRAAERIAGVLTPDGCKGHAGS